VFKKSLVRKFWKDQKHTDKYIGDTFRRRDREKMKTRRNRKNETDCIQKVMFINSVERDKRYHSKVFKENTCRNEGERNR
jgi:hypothetical protein